jgi:hypothetical protein
LFTSLGAASAYADPRKPPPGREWRSPPPPDERWDRRSGPPPYWSKPQWEYRQRYLRRHDHKDDDHDAAAGLIAGVILGYVLGSAVVDTQERHAQVRDQLDDPDWIVYCARRYRSFDPYSGTYLGPDGLRHYCR